MENHYITCPDCGKPLEWISKYICNGETMAICYCEECINGIDKEWEVVYNEKGIQDIHRYFWG